MTLDKAIIYRKERRRPYRRSRRVDRSCRNHGTCSWCRGNRLYTRRRGEAAARREIEEYLHGSGTGTEARGGEEARP